LHDFASLKPWSWVKALDCAVQDERSQVWLQLDLFSPKDYCFFRKIFPVQKEEVMVKKLLILLFTSVLVVPVSTRASAQEAPAQDKTAKQDRWEGVIIRSSSDKSTLTVRKVGSTVEKTVVYDSSTKWVSQEHGSKKVNDIDASQVKDNDRVICTGTYDKDGVLHATLISKRLSHYGSSTP
jgi:hypothetical protein